MTFEQLETLVICWSMDRKIIPNAKPHTQLLKAFSEMGELADAEIKGNIPDMKDAIGDVIVCLINYCELHDLDMIECLQGAYNEIKDRTGTMLENGVFVKD